MEKPIITATQKKAELKDYQIDILESMAKIKSCDFIISINSTKVPVGEYKLQIRKTLHLGESPYKK